jgi:Membrane bound beta barrel domain (DUF5777)
MKIIRRVAIALPFCALSLMAQSSADPKSELPLALNLSTAEHLEGWDIGVRFTHRFDLASSTGGKEAYGLDGYAFAGVGLDFGIKPIKGLNVQIYRTADAKTFTLALHQQLYAGEYFRAAFRAERFDEVVKQFTEPLKKDTVGLVGSTFQAPIELVIPGGGVFSLVPSYQSTSTSYVARGAGNAKGIFNVGLGLRWTLYEKHAILAEYYPRPSKLDKSIYRPGWAWGYQYRTFKHRFAAIYTNVEGTTPHQVLNGDFARGPRRAGSFGFNVVRVF